MSYALQTLWHDKSRYFAGVGAVAFSAVLMALQFGLMLGLFMITSIPLDHTDPRNVWVGSNQVESVDLGQPIPLDYIARIGDRPGTKPAEPFVANFANFFKPDGGSQLCFLLGSKLEPDSAGAANELTPEMRYLLTEPFAIIVDESELGRLGLDKPADPDKKPKINGREVRLVGTVKGMKSLAAPWVFCSDYTARELLGALLPPDHTKYLIIRCDTVERAQAVAADLHRQYKDKEMSAYTAEDFSTKSRIYWLFRTKAGIAIGYAALLGLCVGAVVTAQTLYAATIASAKEYATLFALGIPRSRVYVTVMAQAFWVGVAGVVLAYPTVHALAWLATQAGAAVVLRWEVLAGAAVVTLGTALVAGLLALRAVRTIEPMSLLR